MPTELVGVRRKLTRGRRRRFRRTPPKYTGTKGWNFVDFEVSNAFANIDNVPGNAVAIALGSAFEVLPDGQGSLVGNHDARTVCFRSIRMQALLSVALPDDEAFPYAAYDVGLVKFEEGQVYSGGGPLDRDLRGFLVGTDNRVVWHKRLWAGFQGALQDGEAASSAYGTGNTHSVIDVYLPKVNIPLAKTESLAVILTQVGSELYADTQSAFLAGYVKSWVQLK